MIGLDLTYDEYAAAPGARASDLILMWQKTPLHMHWRLKAATPSTPEQELGVLVHLATLEPDRYKAEVLVAPRVDRRTKAGKLAWEEHLRQAEGRTILTPDDDAKVAAMANALRAHPEAAGALAGSTATERSLFWRDEESGVECKARIDLIATVNSQVLVCDLKTTRDAGRRPFERALYQYGYFIQAVHYLAGVEALEPIRQNGEHRIFWFLCVESLPPYAVAVYQLDDLAVEDGEKVRQDQLAKWKVGIETGEWPGYSPRVNWVALPQWASKQYEEV